VKGQPSHAAPTAVIGIADHSGWAVCVTVAAAHGLPVVVDRRRVELIEPGLPSQPYHHETVRMPAVEAEALVQDVRRSVMRTAIAGLRALCEDVRPHRVAAITLRTPPLPYVPVTVAQAHASYHVMCRADGMMYHDALCTAGGRLNLAVELHDRGTELARAAARLAIGEDALERFLGDAGRALGPPWQKEQRLAAASALAALADRVELSLPP
jgi:hypothetical protein